MKALGVVLIFMTLELSAHTLTPSLENCDFYMKFPTPRSCSPGEKLYTRTYGSKYCRKFLELKRNSSSGNRLKEWISKTSICLQEMLFDNPKRIDNSCYQLAEFAFDTHPICYKQYKFCELPPDDILKIIRTIEIKDVAEHFRKSVTQAINIGMSCLKIRTEDEQNPYRYESTAFNLIFTETRDFSNDRRGVASQIFERAPHSSEHIKDYFNTVVLSAYKINLSEFKNPLGMQEIQALTIKDNKDHSNRIEQININSLSYCKKVKHCTLLKKDIK